MEAVFLGPPPVDASLMFERGTPDDPDASVGPAGILIGCKPLFDLLIKSEVDEILLLVEGGAFKRDEGMADCSIAGG